MDYAENFEDLEVYQLARSLAQRVFEMTKRFPKEETYSLIDQIRRSSRSIGGQIAEAWGKRKYERHFVSKLTDADGEQKETVHWLITSNDCSYISRDEAHELIQGYESVHRMLESMQNKSSSFCR